MRDLKRLGLWDDVMIMDLKHFKGSLHPIDRVPADIKALYSTAFEVEPKWLVEAASRRQKWIDQAQSLNIYMAGASGKKLDDTYKLAWVRGLKTTYYLRTAKRYARGNEHREHTSAQRSVKWGQPAHFTFHAAEGLAAPRWPVQRSGSTAPATDVKFTATIDDVACEKACQNSM